MTSLVTAIGSALLLLTLNYCPVALADDLVDRMLERLRQANNLDPEGNRAQGINFDRYITEFHDKLVDDGLATPIKKTFAGDNIEHGWRVGRTEVWVQKREPVTGRSIDVIVWDVERDAQGNFKSARAIGQDTHPVHPNSPRATALNKKHWQDKVDTAQMWERSLKAKGFDVSIDMNPDNSFYWKDVAAANAAEIDEFSRERSKIAKERLQKSASRGIFSITTTRILGTTVAVLGTTAAGLQVLDALEHFYKSPVVSRTVALLKEGKYKEAKRYWEAKCLVEETAHEDCSQLREALSEASSVLSARAYTDFPTFMNQLFDKWAADARRANPWLGTWKSTWDGDGAEIVMEQDGKTVRGTYSYRKGRLTGRVDEEKPNRITGSWQEEEANPVPDVNEYRGWLQFDLADDGDSFKGVWGKGYGQPLDRKWNGERQ